MELAPEERRRIYEGEKVRIEARAAIRRKRMGSFLRIGCLSSAVLIAVVGLLAVIGNFSGGSRRESPVEIVPALPLQGLPPHKLNDIWRSPNGKSVALFIVVSPHISGADASGILNAYDARFSNTLVLNIDIFCDDTYARYAATGDPSVSDAEYYSHVLYSLFRDTQRRVVSTPEDPQMYSSQGTACRRQRKAK